MNKKIVFLSMFAAGSVFSFLLFNQIARGATTVNTYTYCQEKYQQAIDPKITKITEQFKKSPNYLLYTEYKMLQYKYPTKITDPKCQSYRNYDDYGSLNLRMTGDSPLSKEYAIPGDRRSDLDQKINLLTGDRAISESLQLGSIGSDRNDLTPEGRIRRQLEFGLDSYLREKKEYPENLGQLIPKYANISVINFSDTIKNFQYRRVTKNTYELKLLNPQVNISTVTPLEINSHPWSEMLAGKNVAGPEIFSVIPKDDLAIYFKDIGKFTELENVIKDASGPVDKIYGLKNSVDVKNKIFQRLGIKDIEILRNFIEEGALVAYDFDFSPGTDYALILNLKASIFNDFITNYVTAPKERHGKVGNYYVVATSPEFFDSISAIQNNPARSLRNAADFKYVLSVLEKDYDGLAYLSEGLIQKLTSPAYRINARRRNTVLKAMETLQYTVFAYRDIAGQWPTSIKQIETEGYIKPDSVANQEDYAINVDGIVKHKDWNTIYDPTPISRVAIDQVYNAEKSLYESFAAGYQSFWREFIDPVGVAITVGDKIKLHTIILPLIDESQYNWLKDIGGGNPVPFNFVTKPDRLSAMQVISKFNVNDILYAVYKRSGRYIDDDYEKCKKDYYSSTNEDLKLTEVCKFTEKTRDAAIVYLNQKVAKILGLDEKSDVFGFVGKEITLLAGESMAFKLNDIPKADIVLGIELKDVSGAKNFVDKLYQYFSNEFGREFGSGSRGMGPGGFFSLDTTTPLKNTYNGTDFYIVPLGITNVYYTFLNNRFYLTISQTSINQLIDGVKDGKKTWGAGLSRIFDYLGQEQNVLFFADGTKMQNWIKSYLEDDLWLSYYGKSKLVENNLYYAEALTLAKKLSDYNGTINNVSKYYRHFPTKWFDADMFTKNGEVYIKVGKEEYNTADIQSTNRWDYYPETPSYKTSTSMIPLEKITRKFDLNKYATDWKKFEDMGIALNFTEDGLDIRIAFDNPLSTKLDERIPVNSGDSLFKLKDFKQAIVYVLGGGVLVIVIIASVFLIRKRKKYN